MGDAPLSLSGRAAIRCVTLAALLGLFPACATTTETVRSPARSVRGRMGFGVMSTTQSQVGGTISGFRTAIAGASAPGVEPGGGDWVWRVSKTGTSVELCHGVWASRPCRTALFDGGPNLMGPFIKFSTFPVLVDPVNLGRIGVVSTDSRGNVWVSGNLELAPKNATVPVTPGYGVWALGGGGMLHHCQLEGETPWCHVAKLPNGKGVGGRPLSIKTYGSGNDLREGVWVTGGMSTVQLGMEVTGGGLFHCEVKSGAVEAPVCRLASFEGTGIRFTGASPLSLVLGSHLVRRGDVERHVVWIQIDEDAIVRCQVSSGEAPTCARVKKG